LSIRSRYTRGLDGWGRRDELGLGQDNRRHHRLKGKKGSAECFGVVILDEANCDDNLKRITDC
jgi:hypothetical protein